MHKMGLIVIFAHLVNMLVISLTFVFFVLENLPCNFETIKSFSSF